MSDEVQPGCRIDAALWEQFRQDIKSRRGAVRGHLRTELETALRQYLDGGEPDSFGTVDERLARIEAAVGVASADGGVDTSQPQPHTHAPAEKPAANAATDRKVEYLADRLREDHGGSFEEVSRSAIIAVVKSEYGFRSDTAKRYVDELVNYFDLREKPGVDGILVTPERYQAIVEQSKAEASA